MLPLPFPFLDRPALLERLAMGCSPDVELTLVHAGPGFGKTNLLSAYVKRLPNPSAWLQVRRIHRDPVLIVQDLQRSLREAYPWISSAAGDVIRSLGERGLVRAMGVLLDDLSAGSETPVLVLDDLHEAGTSLEVAETLELLKDGFPRHGQLILAGRTVPRLAHRRKTGSIVSIEDSELAFSLAEVQELAPSHADALDLWKRTEGWPAGVGFALARPGDASLSRFDHPDMLFDFLTQGLLQEQPLDVQQEWLLAAFEPNSPLFATICGGVAPSLSQQAFRREAKKRWQGEAWRSLLTDLAQQRSDPSEQVDLLLQSESWPEALEILRRNFFALADAQHLTTLDGLLDAFPVDFSQTCAWLGYLKGELARRRSDYPTALSLWDSALSTPPRETRAWIRLGQAAIQGACGDWAAQESTLAEALREGREQPNFPLAFAMNIKGLRALALGDDSTAREHLGEALRLYQERRDSPGQARVLHNLGLAWSHSGEFMRAIAFYRESIALARQTGFIPMPLTFNNWALCENYLGQSENGWRLLEEGVALAERLGSRRDRLFLLRTLGQFHAAAGELDRARELFASSRADAMAIGDRSSQLSATWGEIDVLMRENRFQEAEAELELANQLQGRQPGEPLPDEGSLLLAEIWGRTERLDAALKLLDALDSCAPSPFHRSKVEQLRERLHPNTPLGVEIIPPPSPHLELRLLGPFEAAAEGRPVTERDWRTANARLVLAYLAMNPNGATRESLADLLFPERDPARSAISTVVGRLRQALDPMGAHGANSRFVLLQDGRYFLNPGLRIQCDARELERSVKVARRSEGDGAMNAWGQVVELYRGSFMDANTDSSWCDIEREHMRRLASTAYEHLFAHASEQDDWATVEVLADRLLSLDVDKPLAVRARLLALACQDRQEDALRWLQVSPVLDSVTAELGELIASERLTVRAARAALAL